ncbi:hypothetical protein GGX14DRAFT_581820 [Mycena pura]|uniref:Uncharacterized protein n=1 Tax=Mycena pura TaxID=153505 RepID=A0AAD6YUE3_9AGAR|nr:hypothetical protein GGX14DRAFT_581820 [Mycena pura]
MIKWTNPYYVSIRNFAQYCVSKMPDDVCRRIIRDRDNHAKAAYTNSDEVVHFARAAVDCSVEDVAAATVDATAHWTLAAQNLPPKFDPLTTDPRVQESYIAVHADSSPPVSNSFANLPPTFPIPTMSTSSHGVAGTPSKKKRSTAGLVVHWELPEDGDTSSLYHKWSSCLVGASELNLMGCQTTAVYPLLARYIDGCRRRRGNGRRPYLTPKKATFRTIVYVSEGKMLLMYNQIVPQNSG